MAQKREARELSRSSPGHERIEHRESSAAPCDRQARIEHLRALGFTPEAMQAARDRSAAYNREIYLAELRTFTLGLIFRRWLSQQPACNRCAEGVYCVPCPFCENENRSTVIIAPYQPGRDGIFHCAFCPAMRARDVVALLSPAVKDRVVREVTRIRAEWYRLPTDERIALEKSKRERQENDRRIRNEYRIQKAGGAL